MDKTSSLVSDLSGRGVGLDAVRYEAVRLGGSAVLKSEKGVGIQLIVEVDFYDSPLLNSGTVQAAA